MKNKPLPSYSESLFPIRDTQLIAYQRLRDYGIKVCSIDNPLLILVSDRLNKAARLLHATPPKSR